eukprot:COSAG01_NODE_24534_length_775_cov_3.766272_1_plen_107_part_00
MRRTEGSEDLRAQRGQENFQPPLKIPCDFLKAEDLGLDFRAGQQNSGIFCILSLPDPVPTAESHLGGQPRHACRRTYYSLFRTIIRVRGPLQLYEYSTIQLYVLGT